MPARKSKFTKNNHREHRSLKGRDPNYKWRRHSRLRRKFLIEKESEDESEIYGNSADIK